VVRLSPRQINALASCICGDDDAADFDYRRYVDIESFIAFTGAEVGKLPSSRWNYARSFIEACQAAGEEGTSGLGREVEKMVEALLDRREFSSESRRDEALLKVNQILTGMPVEARIGPDGSVQVVSTSRQPRSGGS
jgi:hypothetical protein